MSESRSRVIYGFFSLVGVMFIPMLVFLSSPSQFFSKVDGALSINESNSVVGVVEVTGPIMESKGYKKTFEG